MGIFGSKTVTGLPVASFDADKRYDFYLQIGDSLTCIRNVKCQCIRTWEKFDPEDETSSMPVDSYLEVVDASNNTISISTSSIVFYAENGSTIDLSKFHI